MRGMLFSLLCQQALKRKGRPSGLIGQYKPYLNSNDSPTRDILKDYSGQGHDIQLYNFGYALGSGYGSWPFNPLDMAGFSKGQPYGTLHFTVDGNYAESTIIGISSISFKIRIRGLRSIDTDMCLRIVLRDRDAEQFIAESEVKYFNEGIYSYKYENTEGKNIAMYFYNSLNNKDKADFYADILPDYPGALVSDGVDDYGLCENFPILTKEKGYTIIMIRKILSNSGYYVFSNSSNPNATDGFCQFEHVRDRVTRSYGSANNVDFPDLFSYQTSLKYNGKEIKTFDYNPTDKIVIFKHDTSGSGYRTSVALYALEIYDHDLTDEEIEKVKEAMYEEYLTATNALQNNLIADYECYDRTNEDEDRDVLKDLSGNGHDITLYNFGFAEGSGYGLYGTNFINLTHYQDRAIADISNSKIIVREIKTNDNFIESRNVSFIKGYKIKVTNEQNITLKYAYFSDENSTKSFIDISASGIYDLPDSYKIFTGFVVHNFIGTCNITIEQIPEYQGALVSDGVDDYGLCENFPILNKEDGYTILAIRKWLNVESDSDKIFLSNSAKWTAGALGAFSMERINSSGTMCNFFGNANYVTDIFNPNTSLVYQTNNSYQGKTFLNIGSEAGQDVITLFCSDEAYKSWKSSIALYALKIFDRDLTDEEIAYEKKKMIQKYYEKTGDPSLYAVARYECYDKTNEDSDRSVLEDLTGNGHNITLNNFAFAEESGYGKYNWNFNNFTTNTAEHTSSKITLTSSDGATFEKMFSPSSDVKGVTVKITGITNSSLLLYCKVNTKDNNTYPSINNDIQISKDGIYTLPDTIIPEDYYGNLGSAYYGFKSIIISEGETVVIEQIPDYKGALVSDGIDDYGICENFPDLPIEKGFTICAIRENWKGDIMSNAYLITKASSASEGEFMFENANVSEIGNYNVVSYGVGVRLTYNNKFSYMTSSNYNGNTITKGTSTNYEGDLYMFKLREAYIYRKAALYALEIYPRDLTEDEIQIVKDRMIKQYEAKTGEKFEELN